MPSHFETFHTEKLAHHLRPLCYIISLLHMTEVGLDGTGHSVRCIAIVLATDDKLSSGKLRKKREPKKPFRIDFNQISDEKQFSKSKVRKCTLCSGKI